MEFIHYLPRPLPDALHGLAELALDLRWSWNHGADKLWAQVDPELWEVTENPWLILEVVSHRRLEALAEDAEFLRQLEEQLAARREHLAQPTWFRRHHGGKLGKVAYFCMEFGLGKALPIYSGGLGILAGDYLKTACDLGVPVVGVGLLYQKGYFHQSLDAQGHQLAFFPYNDPTMLPVMPLRDEEGEWLRVGVEFPGRTLWLRTWEAWVGRTRLYLLDSNDLLNIPRDRGITGELYVGDPEIRLQQEMVLGIGGWRLLRALNLDVEVCHLNEGHAALAVLERARDFMERSGKPFPVALRCTRAGNLFTTHTPVEAGFDRFPRELIRQYLGEYARQLGIPFDELFALGGPGPVFNMAYLALHGSGWVNGVSRLHGEVSRRIFAPLFPRWPLREVPIEHVTNGIHMPSWDSDRADALWTEACGKHRWIGDLKGLEAGIRGIGDETLWALRGKERQALIEKVRRRLVRQMAAHGVDQRTLDDCRSAFDPNALTLGFARRFAAYKRPDLLLHDPERLVRLLADKERPVQILVAGKAHPFDEEGKRLVEAWARFAMRPDAFLKAVFLEDYDIELAGELVAGVDLWLNTPRRPWEACGTSGMKVLVNGGLNLSELDGWWAEAYTPGVGWAFGDGREHGADPAWDAQEAEALYRLLEEEVIPAFYGRDERGIPEGWVSRMRESMALLAPRFSSNRMLREYTERGYIPLAAAYRRRTAGKGRLGAELEAWHASLGRHWSKVRFGDFQVEEEEGIYRFQVQAYLDELDPEAVRVELYAESEEGPVRQVMERAYPLEGAVGGFLYTAEVPAARPAWHFTPRIVPYHPEAHVPLEAPFILWQR